MILDLFFKIIISCNLFENINSQEFISIIKAKAKHYLKHPTNIANTAYSTKRRKPCIWPDSPHSSYAKTTAPLPYLSSYTHYTTIFQL